MGLLRQAAINNQLSTVKLVGDNVVIGGRAFPRKTKTEWMNSKTGAPYELDSIWLLLSNTEFHTKPSKYFIAFKAQKIAEIQYADQAKLLAYMRGQQDVPSLKPTTFDGSLSSIATTQTENVEPTKPPEQWSISDIYAQEKPLSTTTTILQNPKDADLSSALTIFDEAVRKRLHPEKPTIPAPAEPAAVVQRLVPVAPPAQKRARTEESFIPIIIVPQAPTAVISMYNAESFLNLGVYITGEEAKSQLGEDGKKKEIGVCERKSYLNPSKNCKFYIMDNVSKITPEMWYRVVAVFATGAEWQFKNWPWKTPPEIFDNVKGYHLFYDDEALNAKIAKWNIHKLAISKIKRYRDRSVVTDFWESLQTFIHARNNQRQLFF